MQKKTPVIRTCVVCRKKEKKSDLIRYALIDKEIEKNPTHQTGRGVYLCSQCERIYMNGSEKEKATIKKRMLFALHHKQHA